MCLITPYVIVLGNEKLVKSYLNVVWHWIRCMVFWLNIKAPFLPVGFFYLDGC